MQGNQLMPGGENVVPRCALAGPPYRRGGDPILNPLKNLRKSALLDIAAHLFSLLAGVGRVVMVVGEGGDDAGPELVGLRVGQLQGGDLLKVLRRCAEKKPLIKHIVISYHTDGANPIQLIFDDDPTIAPTHENFVRTHTIKLTDSGGTEEQIVYEGDLKIFADFEEGIRKMAIRYSGGYFVFTDRYSLDHWNCPAAHLFHNVRIFLAW